jgi:hypothetical protein
MFLHGHQAFLKVGNLILKGTCIRAIQCFGFWRFVAILAGLCAIGALRICIITLSETYEWQKAKKGSLFDTLCFLLLHLSQAVRCLFLGLLASSILGEVAVSWVFRFEDIKLLAMWYSSD